jgi:bifunctional non-homologous end joining protein LigD
MILASFIVTRDIVRCRSTPPRHAAPRFGSPLALSRVHWVRPERVAEVKFLAWTVDNLLRQVVFEALREDKSAREVRREIPRPGPQPRRRPLSK